MPNFEEVKKAYDLMIQNEENIVIWIDHRAYYVLNEPEGGELDIEPYDNGLGGVTYEMISDGDEGMILEEDEEAYDQAIADILDPLKHVKVKWAVTYEGHYKDEFGLQLVREGEKNPEGFTGKYMKWAGNEVEKQFIPVNFVDERKPYAHEDFEREFDASRKIREEERAKMHPLARQFEDNFNSKLGPNDDLYMSAACAINHSDGDLNKAIERLQIDLYNWRYNHEYTVNSERSDRLEEIIQEIKDSTNSNKS